MKQFVIVLTILGLAAATATAQTAHVTENTKNTPDQILRSNARVNPSTLAMEMSIPIANFPGRSGVGKPIVLNYTSKLWRFELNGHGETQTVKYTVNLPRYAEKTAAGWTSTLGDARLDLTEDTYDCNGNPLGEVQNPVPPLVIPPGGEYPPGYCGSAIYHMNRVRVHLPDGSTIQLRKDDSSHNYATEPLNRVGVYFATDGSRARLEIFEGNAATLYMPDGSRYLWDANNAGSYVDRNGNRLVFDPTARTWTDTLGRSLVSPFPANDIDQAQTVGTQTFPLLGLTGSPNRSYQLVWKNLSDEGVLLDPNEELLYAADQTCPHIGALVPSLFIGGLQTRLCRDAIFDPVVLKEIVLPDGSKYKFQYNKFGEITKIDYPTGASERFEYAQVPTLSYRTDLTHDQANRGVVDRWVKENAGAAELHWQYEAFKETNRLRIKTTAPDDLTITEQYVESNWSNDFQPHKTKWGFDNPLAGRPYEERVYSGTTLLRRTLTEYEYFTASNGVATRDPKTKREISVIFEPGDGNALVSMTSYLYDINGSSDPNMFAAQNRKSSEQFGFIVVAAGTAGSETVVQLAARFNGITPKLRTETDYSYDTNYTNSTRSFIGMPAEERIVNPVTSAVVAKTQYRYDEYAFESSGSLPSFASATWSDPGTAYRGNVTSVRRYSDIGGSQYVETHSFFDKFGNVRKARDARDNDAETEYDAAYAFAYPTLVRTPVPDTSGVHGSNTAFTSTTVYDLNTGLPTSATDANGQTTTIEYVDQLLRPTKVTAPNGHQTTTAYGEPDTTTGQLPSSERFIKVRSQIDETRWKEGYTWFDGLGRTVKTQSIDSNGDIFVYTEYDVLSRPHRVTNPYRNQEPIYWTERTFDIAGRPWKVTTADGAFVETTYGIAATGTDIGTWVTVKDQAGKLRRSITNAFGHLKRVDEPDNAGVVGPLDAPKQPTLYSYDLLNNLTQVQQAGDNNDECGPSTTTCSQTRTFAYDSLSRLKQASNPESGTISYSYDPNGNVEAKTDVRGIVTTYAYDALNRVKTRTYTSEPTGSETPDVSYFYDLVQNAKGRLIKVTNGTGANRSTTEYVEFDILGRVKRTKQTTDGIVYGDDANPMTYTYNISGALIEQRYPSGRVVKNVLDTDGAVATVQSKKDSNHAFWNFANHISYHAAGAVTSMQLGNGRWESTTFNSRLQPTQIALGATENATNLLDLDYSYGTTQNNGNVLSQTITVPAVGATAGFTAVQSYSYDLLNRIQVASETLTPTTGPPETWTQEFEYDRYGNRTFKESTTTTLLKECNGNTEVCAAVRPIVNPSINPSNNRLNGYTFDTAGNTTRDAQNRKFTYDAEHKQVKVETFSGETVTATVGEYFYGGDGKRVKKRAYVDNILTEETIFVYDAAGKLVAEYSNQVASAQYAKVAYLTNDHLGSPRINTDVNGNITTRHDYYPFGEEVTTSKRPAGLGYEGDTVRKQFTGYERDDETGLDFAQARYFASNHGRFSSPDDFLNDTDNQDPASWNLYVYVRNNPLVYVDPTGTEFRLAQRMDKNGKIVETVGGKDRDTFLKWLNHTYGCNSCVTIDNNNFVRLDKSKVSKEVLAVTTDLTTAIEDKTNVVGVVGVRGEETVRFAEAHLGGESINRKRTDVIRVDFADFEKLTGSREAISSFTNYAFVHEALHLYPNPQQDTLSGDDVTGPVENRVNEIRHVRGDLLRANYVASVQDGISTAWFGPAKRDGKNLRRNHNQGLIAESTKSVSWIRSQVSNK